MKLWGLKYSLPTKIYLILFSKENPSAAIRWFLSSPPLSGTSTFSSSTFTIWCQICSTLTLTSRHKSLLNQQPRRAAIYIPFKNHHWELKVTTFKKRLKHMQFGNSTIVISNHFKSAYCFFNIKKITCSNIIAMSHLWRIQTTKATTHPVMF